MKTTAVSILCLILFVSLGTMSLCAETKLVFDPDSQIGNFTVSEPNYALYVTKSTDMRNAAPFSSRSMKITEISPTDTSFWRLVDGTSSSWGPGGDTTAWLNYPIEIELLVKPQDAVNFRDDTTPANLDLAVFRFSFGNSMLNRISLLLRRSFFLTYSSPYVYPREDRTGQWLVLSIVRDSVGDPVELQWASHNQGVYQSVPTNEYSLTTEYVDPENEFIDWEHTTSKTIEGWGLAPDRYSFYVGRMAFGPLIQDPLVCGEPRTTYYDTDVNQDCLVNLGDLAVFSENWMKCSDPNNFNDDCDAYWR